MPVEPTLICPLRCRMGRSRRRSVPPCARAARSAPSTTSAWTASRPTRFWAGGRWRFRSRVKPGRSRRPRGADHWATCCGAPSAAREWWKPWRSRPRAPWAADRPADPPRRPGRHPRRLAPRL